MSKFPAWATDNWTFKSWKADVFLKTLYFYRYKLNTLCTVSRSNHNDNNNNNNNNQHSIIIPFSFLKLLDICLSKFCKWIEIFLFLSGFVTMRKIVAMELSRVGINWKQCIQDMEEAQRERHERECLTKGQSEVDCWIYINRAENM